MKNAPFNINCDEFARQNKGIIKVDLEKLQQQSEFICRKIWNYVQDHTPRQYEYDNLSAHQKEKLEEAAEYELFAFLKNSGDMSGEYGVSIEGGIIMTNEQIESKQLCLEARESLKCFERKAWY